MAARILVIGFDACDPGLATRWAGEGRMPVLAQLLATSTRLHTEPLAGATNVGGVWATLATGRRPAHHRYAEWSTIDPATYQLRPTHLDEEGSPPFWVTLARRGHRVAVIDVPRTTPNRALGDQGIQLCDWATHDRTFGTASWPPQLVDDVLTRFGDQRLGRPAPDTPPHYAPCDWVHGGPRGPRTPEQLGALRDALLEALDTKARASAHYLAEASWDLYVTVFGEAHCAAHSFWSLHDGDHPEHDAGVAALLGDPVADVYTRLDQALGHHLELAGPDSTVFVVFSHGAAPNFSGNHLLDAILERLASSETAPRPARRRGWLRRAWHALPARVRRRLHPAVARAVRWRQPGQQPLPDLSRTPERLAARPYYSVPSASEYGGIRLNLAGREARGAIAPAQRDAVLARLTDELLDLVEVDGRRSAVARVTRSEDVAGDLARDGYADLFVQWDRRGPVRTVYSPTVGLLRAEAQTVRSGDHRAGGLVLARGPGLSTDADVTVAPEHVAPTIAAVLGVELPGADGRPITRVLAPASPATS